MATETTLSDKTLQDIEKAAQVLAAGGLVAVPTETVYGLAADADNPTAVRSTFTAKGRPADHPLIVHVTGFEALSAWVSEIPECTKTLTDAFWPGPLTLVFKKSDRVNDAVTGGQDTVAIRCPSHPVMRALLKRFAGTTHKAVTAPSANTFGRISPTNAKHVADDLGVKPAGKLDMILDGGECEVGVESTIVNLTSERPTILRHGAVTAAMMTMQTQMGSSPRATRPMTPVKRSARSTTGSIILPSQLTVRVLRAMAPSSQSVLAATA